ncbi:hypothetical protein [Geoglobus acetivorans]|uniref:Uncharacterized protein n=1 Tax=Geoglobus acetivorans TaxID=565033 RepID=A0A0A7GF49_GEOAI|nr:hypothetical protein GACE_1654 [Geoglobus acetivorans]
MDEREKKALTSSLQRSSIAGTAIMSFALALLVLYYAKVSMFYSIVISAAFAAITTLARSRSRL